MNSYVLSKPEWPCPKCTGTRYRFSENNKPCECTLCGRAFSLEDTLIADGWRFDQDAFRWVSP